MKFLVAAAFIGAGRDRNGLPRVRKDLESGRGADEKKATGASREWTPEKADDIITAETPPDDDNVDDMDGDDQEGYDEDGHAEQDDESPTKQISVKGRIRTVCSKVKHFVMQTDPHGHDDVVHLPHYRWTPIVTGIVMPFAILLEIPGLTEHWYVRTVNNVVVESRTNPKILDAGMGLSMACALIANLCIITRFFEIHIKATSIAAICALCIHDVINITVVTVFGVVHRFNDGFTYGQPFWFTVCSTVASVVAILTLAWDLHHIKDFANSGSGLTRKQRSLVIIVMILLCWIGVGGLIYSLLLKLSFIDGMYYTIVSIETVGFGDIVPKTTAARIFSVFHTTIGVLNLALAVATCRETIIESFEHSYRDKFKKMRKKRRERNEHRAQHRAEKVAMKRQLRDAGLPIYVPGRAVASGGGRAKHHTHKGKLNVEALSDEQRQAAIREAAEILAAKHHRHRHRHFHRHKHSDMPVSVLRTEGASQNDRSVPVIFSEPESDVGVSPLSFKRIGRSATFTSDAGSYRKSNSDLSFRTRGRTSTLPLPDNSSIKNSLSFKTHGRTATFASDTGPVRDDDTNADDTDEISNRNLRTRERTTTFVSDITTQDDNNDLSFKNRGRSATMNSELSSDLISIDHSSLDATDQSYTKFVQEEQEKEFSTKLIVVWTLFVLFWLVGSAIFSQTEGWSYGIAMWFCFVAFSTVGYGDFTPVTPAGRAVFIVWALLGVGTMTILISVLSEAYSSRYQMALYHVDASSSELSLSDHEHDPIPLPPRPRKAPVHVPDSEHTSVINLPIGTSANLK
ncbi:voltage-gated potassium channel [Rickenella mellea]|uniref:Voltage-gated potassium channel n=1 Tax=Rickenella mellea TaxID=50990 RepID=A0A4Y7Q3V0_9AGAM|nr:voltage-gated potassium channel [Rickenella mellea]